MYRWRRNDEKNKPSNGSGYSGPAYDHIRWSIPETLEKHDQRRLRHVIDYRSKNVILDLFEEALEQAKGIVYTHLFEVTNQATVKVFFNEGVDELHDNNMYKLAESQEFTQGLVRHFIKSLAFTAPVTRFVKQQSKKAVACESKFRKDVSWEILIKKEMTPPSPLTGRSCESPKTFQDYRKKKKKVNLLLTFTSSPHHVRSWAQADNQTGKESMKMIKDRSEWKLSNWWVITSPSHRTLKIKPTKAVPRLN